MAATVKKRILSLDSFRGFTVAAMILVNTLAISAATPSLLKHTDWIGLNLADLVFPFFLFIVGVSMTYSFANRKGQTKRQIWGHFLWRVVALYAIGLFLNALAWFLYGAPLRIPGVLQLIALSSLLAAPFANLKPKWIFLVALIFMGVHSLILLELPVPGASAGSLQMGANIDDYIDVKVFTSQHLLAPDSDPEGLLSTITSTAMVLLGLVVGRTLRLRGGTQRTMGILIVFGTVLVLLGTVFSMGLPIIKQLWTSSFILVTAGLATILLSALYILMDLLEFRKILDLGIPLGRNALVIYTLSIPLGMILTWEFIHTSEGQVLSIFSILVPSLQQIVGDGIGILIYGLSVVFFWWIVAYVLYRRKIFIKL